MKIVGLHFTTNANGQKNTTLQVVDDYNPYYENAEAGRGCIGIKKLSRYMWEVLTVRRYELVKKLKFFMKRLLQRQKELFSQ